MKGKRLKAGNTTRLMWCAILAFSILWVTWSYVIATYSTMVLMQPFPAEELSREAMRTILSVGFMKLAENVFEHNNGGLFGQTREEI